FADWHEADRPTAGCQPSTQQTGSLRYRGVAQTVCLLFRRLAVGRPTDRRLPTCDTADWQSALQGCSADSLSAVSPTGSRQTDRPQVANLRHGRLAVCVTGV